MKKIVLLTLTMITSGCATYPDVKEVKLIGFTENLERGKSSQSLTADDCVYYIMGYALGAYPEISQAVANAQTGTSSRAQDVITGEAKSSRSFRYVNRLTAGYTGFNAGVFGKTCIQVKGVGYL